MGERDPSWIGVMGLIHGVPDCGIHQNANYCIRILFTDVSDHFSVLCVYELCTEEKHKEIYILQRIFSERNRQPFYAALSEI